MMLTDKGIVMTTQFRSRSLRQGLQNILLSSFTAATLFAAVNSYADENSLIPAKCELFGVHDELLNDTQFVQIKNGLATKLGNLHPGHDIEGMDVTSDGQIYAASGDDPSNGLPAGHLYRVNKQGEIDSVGDIRFTVKGQEVSGKEIAALSFRFADNTLWGWAEECGLIKINPDTAEATLELAYPDGEAEGYETCLNMDPASYTSHIEDMTWDTTGRTIYFVDRKELQSYTPKRTDGQEEIQSITTLHSPIEAIEALPDGNLLLAVNNTTKLMVVDPMTGEQVSNANINVGAYTDIEAFTWSCPLPTQNCETPTWTYVKDSFTDGTGTGNIVDINGNKIVRGVTYELFGVAIRQDGENVTIAFNSNMGLRGTDVINRNAADNNISWTDFVFDFGGKKYAVHYAAGNDSGVTELGLYKDITLKNVNKENWGWSSMSQYYNSTNNAGKKPSLGDLSNYGYGYFDFYKKYSVPISIASGTRVEGDEFRLLYEAELEQMGLDFKAGLNSNNLGPYTFGFTFKKLPEMTGNFTAYTFTECINDGIAIVRKFPLPSCE